jgi:predicted permease
MGWWSHIAAALRGVRRNPGHAAAFVVTLGLAIGVNSAVFSVVHAVLLSPLPFQDADRIVYLQQPAVRAGVANATFSFHEVADYREGVDAFDEVVEFGDWNFSVVPADGTEPHRAVAGLVTSNFFEVLGMAPALGRTLEPVDDRVGAEPVMVLTDEYFTRVFGGDPEVLDRTVELSGMRTRIVGVLEPGVHYTGSRRPDFYANYTTNDHYQGASMMDQRTHRMTDVFARLTPGATLEDATREATALSARLQQEYPDAYPERLGFDLTVSRWQDELTRDARPILLLLMGTVATVLLLACANLANLTLSRLVRREGELATRGALGASPVALRGSLVAENVVLAVGGALLGLVLAWLARGALAAYAGRFTVRADEVAVGGTVLALTLAVGVGVAVLLAFLPGLPVAPAAGGRLSAAAGRTTASRGRRRVQRGLVVTQLALSFALLTSAGLLVRSLLSLQDVDPGFETENVLTLQAFQSFATTGPVVTNDDLFRRLGHEVMAFPGVRAVGVASFAPLGGVNPMAWSFQVEGGDDGEAQSVVAAFNQVTPGYFDALAIPLLRGRYLEMSDRADTEPVVVIGEGLARQLFGADDPVGRNLAWSFSGQAMGPWHRVVGVVADGRQFGMNRDAVPVLYRPAEQAGYGFTVVAATTGDSGPLARAITDQIHAVDPTRPVDRIRTVEDLVAEDLAPSRLNATLFGAFAVLALAIAAVGVLGVLAFSVGQRSREFGLRMALGADRGRVLRSVLAEGAALVGLSLAIGGLGALALGRAMQGLLFQIDPFDPLTFAAAAGALAAIAMAAAFLPAWRAAAVDPMTSLRGD